MSRQNEFVTDKRTKKLTKKKRTKFLGDLNTDNRTHGGHRLHTQALFGSLSSSSATCTGRRNEITQLVLPSKFSTANFWSVQT